MTAGERLAAAAADLLGCRFRLHGRDPETGLDCVGLIAVALRRMGVVAEFPLDYALKCKADARIAAFAERAGLVRATGDLAAGDVVLLEVGPCQLHFAICASGGGVIHAHAGLRRIVSSPRLPEGTIAGHWRLLHS